MNKKIFRLISAALAAVTLISAAAIPSMAAAPDLTVKVDGKVIGFPDQEPTIVKDRTLVPVRFIAENLGYDVEWDKDANAAVIDNGRIVLYIGTDQAKIDGKAVTLDVASTLINDRTMVPLRVVAETLNCTVDWFGTNRTEDWERMTKLCSMRKCFQMNANSPEIMRCSPVFRGRNCSSINSCCCGRNFILSSVNSQDFICTQQKRTNRQ